jgi:hypothetical protein
VINQSRLLFIFIFQLGFFSAIAQTTIAFQGFEGTGADNWGFTPPTQNTTAPMVSVGAGNYGSGYAVTGNRSMRIGGGSPVNGCSGASSNSINCITGGGYGNCTSYFNGTSVEFAPVNISCYSAVTLSVAHRTHALTLCPSGGSGMDNGEQVSFETSLNGGPWITQSTILGSGDCGWLYTTTSVSCASNPTVANPYVYNVPAGTQTIAFRVRMQYNRTDEVVYLDNLRLMGTSNALPPVSIQHINP